MTDSQRQYAERIIKYAIELGAVDAVAFSIEDIVFDPRTIIKCMFGCSDWGKGLTCPSANPQMKMEDYEKVFKKYSYGIIVHANDKTSNHDISFELERRAFQDGYYFAFSLSDCAVCKVCAGFDGQDCRNKKKARPAFHSVGIDVFKTVRNLGLPLYTLKAGDERPENWYAAVFIE